MKAINDSLWVDVILPLPVEGFFTYRVPENFIETIAVGKRVLVQFGRQKIYSAIIAKVYNQTPLGLKTKEIIAVIDDVPCVKQEHLRFWKWMSSYYMCSVGEVMDAAMPTLFKLESKTSFEISLNKQIQTDNFSAEEKLFVEALLNRRSVTYKEALTLCDHGKLIKIIKSLVAQNIVSVREDVVSVYKEKTEKYIHLSVAYQSDKDLSKLLDRLQKKAMRQYVLVIRFLQLAENIGGLVKEKELLNEGGTQSLKTLLRKKIFEQSIQKVSRVHEKRDVNTHLDMSLDKDELGCSKAIWNGFEKHKVVLLKTSVYNNKLLYYAKLIEDVISKNKQVLVLSPEINIATETYHFLKKYFGDKVTMYHSGISDNERYEIWNTFKSDKEFQIVVGTRSALFLPFNRFGMIIVDDEHDQAYKQYEALPYYHARDAAVYLGDLFKAKVLLSSTTPSIESFFNVQTKKYAFVEASNFKQENLPIRISVINLKDAIRRKGSVHFSKYLLDKIHDVTNKHEQVVLFQSRRGFALRIECEHCGYTPTCKQCDVTLIYHKQEQQLRCHYCGYSMPLLSTCPSCKTGRLTMKGYGTEKIEEDLSLIYPTLKILRLDYDVVRSQAAAKKRIQQFVEHKGDVLVGTQMLTRYSASLKANVLGIINVDQLFTFPDFRAFERAFQLLVHLLNIIKDNPHPEIILQTRTPEHYVIECLKSLNYTKFYQRQIADRKMFNYPPYSRLVSISVQHKNKEIVEESAEMLAKKLKPVFGKNLLGPEYPMVSRIKNQYIKTILIKMEKNLHLQESKSKICDQVYALKKQKEYGSVRVLIDVDPL